MYLDVRNIYLCIIFGLIAKQNHDYELIMSIGPSVHPSLCLSAHHLSVRLSAFWMTSAFHFVLIVPLMSTDLYLA